MVAESLFWMDEGKPEMNEEKLEMDEADVKKE